MPADWIVEKGRIYAPFANGGMGKQHLLVGSVEPGRISF